MAREQLFLPVLELLQHGAQRDTARLQEHQQVIEEIGRLGRETVFILRIRRNYNFNRFFSNLLRDLAAALFQQQGRVGTRLRIPRPAGDQGGEATQLMPARIFLFNRLDRFIL
jgi:hypothetical protein